MAVLDREMGKSWVDVGSGLWNDKMGGGGGGARGSEKGRREGIQTKLPLLKIIRAVGLR